MTKSCSDDFLHRSYQAKRIEVGHKPPTLRVRESNRNEENMQEAGLRCAATQELSATPLAVGTSYELQNYSTAFGAPICLIKLSVSQLVKTSEIFPRSI